MVPADFLLELFPLYLLVPLFPVLLLPDSFQSFLDCFPYLLALRYLLIQEKADLGISFCGSGGAGALTAATKYGYPERHGMRSIEEGVTAINDGKTVLGFGFMDQEELGKRVTEAFIKKHGA